MLRFFRQIRQSLLTDNKFSKYLLYAVGEILLVVIGILIALQIDTWRGNQVDKSLRHSYIASFKRDLAADTLLLQFLNEYMEEDIQYHRSLYRRISSEAATKDTLVKVLRKEYSPYFSPSNAFNTATFERINANGHFDLLDSTLGASILRHRARQIAVVGMLDKNIQAMFNTFEMSLQKFPNIPDTTAYGNPLFPNQMGKLERRFWEKSDENELFATLNSLLIMKLQQETIIVGLRKQMIGFTRELLTTFEEYEK
jgi:hypothetical protein